ncbi:MAG: DUF222 domain-containing protein [Acidimicrobiales bacterium]
MIVSIEPTKPVPVESAEPVALRSGLGELNDLSDVLSMLGKVDLDAIAGEQIADAVVDLHSLKNRLDALFATSLRSLADSRVLDGPRMRSAASFLKVNTHMSGGVADRWKRVAHRLCDMPATEASFKAGRISLEHVLVMVSVYNHRQCRWAFEAAEAADLIPAAETKDWVYFKACCDRFVQVADPSQGENRADDQEAKAAVHLSPTLDGMYRLDGWLQDVEGEIVSNELTRLEQAEFRADWGEAKQRLHRDPNKGDLSRTTAQRKAAALAVMARRSAALGSAPVANMPCINVLIDWETFVAVTNQMSGLDAELPADGLRQTEAGHNVSPTQLAQLLLDGHVRRVVFDPKGHVLNFGYKTPYFSGALREAIMLRDRHCKEPGCGLPARLCEIDHIKSRRDHGETSEYNGQALCGFHNGAKNFRSHPQPVLTSHPHRLTWYIPKTE